MIHTNKSSYNKPISDLNKDFPSGFKTIYFRLLPSNIKLQIISSKILQMEKDDFRDVCSLLNFTLNDTHEEKYQLKEYKNSLTLMAINTGTARNRIHRSETYEVPSIQQFKSKEFIDTLRNVQHIIRDVTNELYQLRSDVNSKFPNLRREEGFTIIREAVEGGKTVFEDILFHMDIIDTKRNHILIQINSLLKKGSGYQFSMIPLSNHTIQLAPLSQTYTKRNSKRN